MIRTNALKQALETARVEHHTMSVELMAARREVAQLRAKVQAGRASQAVVREKLDFVIQLDAKVTEKQQLIERLTVEHRGSYRDESGIEFAEMAQRYGTL